MVERLGRTRARHAFALGLGLVIVVGVSCGSSPPPGQAGGGAGPGGAGGLGGTATISASSGSFTTLSTTVTTGLPPCYFCDEMGDCKSRPCTCPLDQDCQACVTCAAQGHCASWVTACDESPLCTALRDCLRGCLPCSPDFPPPTDQSDFWYPDSVCRESCLSEHPKQDFTFESLAECVYRVECHEGCELEEACGTSSQGAGGAGGSGGAGGTGG